MARVQNMPDFGTGAGSIEDDRVLDLAILPRHGPTEDGALAPRRPQSQDIKAMYEAAGLISLRSVVFVMAQALCEDTAVLRGMCHDLGTWLHAEMCCPTTPSPRRAEVPEQSVLQSEDLFRALAGVSDAIQEVEELRGKLEQVEENSFSRLHGIEIESSFKLQEAQSSLVDQIEADRLKRRRIDDECAQLQSELIGAHQQCHDCETQRALLEQESRQSQEEAELLIEELNTENQDLSDNLAKEQVLRVQADEAAQAAMRQVCVSTATAAAATAAATAAAAAGNDQRG